MRIVGNSDSADFWRLHFLDGLIVKLDGVEVKNCTVADDVEGFAIVHVDDKFGRPIIEGNVVKTCRKSGKVEFIGERRAL